MDGKNKIAVINTGFLRTWDKCRENHERNLYTPDTDLFWFTFEDPCYRGQFLRVPYIWYPAPDAHPYDVNKEPETGVYQALNMWHNIFVSFCLAPKGYDVYVRCRPDILFSDRLELQVQANTVYIPEGNDFRGGVNDQFAYGDYETMKIYFSLYLSYKEYFNAGVKFHPEAYLRHHMEVNGIRIERIKTTQWILRP